MIKSAAVFLLFTGVALVAGSGTAGPEAAVAVPAALLLGAIGLLVATAHGFERSTLLRPVRAKRRP